MNTVYTLGDATVGAVRDAMTDPPSYSAVRTTMGILVDKGCLKFRSEGRQYVYKPVVSTRSARRSALRQMVETFFAGSPESAVAALLDMKAQHLDDDELKRLEQMVRQARKTRERPR